MSETTNLEVQYREVNYDSDYHQIKNGLVENMERFFNAHINIFDAQNEGERGRFHAKCRHCGKEYHAKKGDIRALSLMKTNVRNHLDERHSIRYPTEATTNNDDWHDYIYETAIPASSKGGQ